MAKKSTKEKKLRRQKNKEKNIEENEITYDIFFLLKTEPLTTKPELGDFLKKYVKSIRVLVSNSKVTLYPVHSFEISKVFIDFYDGHQIISDFSKTPREYFVYYKVDEIEFDDNEKKKSLITNFIQKLQEFSFIHN